MKRRYIIVFAISCVLLFFAANNPKQEEYAEWASRSLFQQEGILQTGVEKHLASPMINASTKTYNLLVFSLFETTNPINGEVTITIGLFNQFF